MNSGKRFLSLFCLSILLSSCMHVTPVIKDSEEVEFDGNNQDGGVVAFLPQGGLEVTIHAVNKYNALIGMYGDKIGISRDFGLSKLEDGNFSMTKEAFEDWYKMKLMDERDETERAK